jgi:hypothetical protein
MILNHFFSLLSVSLPRADIMKKLDSEPFPIYCHLNPRHNFYTTEGLRADNLGFYAQYAVEGSEHEVSREKQKR